MNWPDHIQDVVAHLVWMASIPGAKLHAWFQANDMARRWPELYADIPTLLTVEMSKRKPA